MEFKPKSMKSAKLSSQENKHVQPTVCSEKKKEEHMRGGHVTVALQGGVAAKDFKGASKPQFSFSEY